MQNKHVTFCIIITNELTGQSNNLAQIQLAGREQSDLDKASASRQLFGSCCLFGDNLYCKYCKCFRLQTDSADGSNYLSDLLGANP